MGTSCIGYLPTSHAVDLKQRKKITLLPVSHATDATKGIRRNRKCCHTIKTAVWMYDLANSRKITPICCPPTGQTAHGKKLKINTEVGLKPFVVTKKLS